MRTPIILVTARTLEAEKVLGLDVGADDYVTKPFSHREVRARIKAVLRRTQPEVAEVYCFGDVEVDFARGELRRAGKPVDTTQLEFKLLGALVKKKTLPVVLVCETGARSHRAVALAKKLGYEQAQAMAGGLKAWKAANLPVEKA